MENSGRHMPTCLKYLYLGNRNEKWEGRAEVEENSSLLHILVII